MDALLGWTCAILFIAPFIVWGVVLLQAIGEGVALVWTIVCQEERLRLRRRPHRDLRRSPEANRLPRADLRATIRGAASR